MCMVMLYVSTSSCCYTGPNWTALEVPGNLQKNPMLPIVLLVPLSGQEHPLLLVGGCSRGAVQEMWVLNVDRGVWSEVSGLICLVYDELLQECISCYTYVLLLAHVTGL